MSNQFIPHTISKGKETTTEALSYVGQMPVVIKS